MEIDSELPTMYQNFIHKSRYARWRDDLERRETWPETVSRYFDFFQEHLEENFNYNLTKKLRKELEDSILELKVMPSMRALMTAGEALKRDNICAYNCAYITIDTPRSFDETLYILLNGTGVGFSVERQYVQKLPLVADELFNTDTTIIVADSKLGWAKAFKELISLLYSGQIPKWDTSRVRPAGTPLKTFGGRASGPEPLEDLFRFATQTFINAAGRRLTSLECHDIVCKTAEIVVVGGVRRSALISLSNLSDERMRMAKMGDWSKNNIQRALANNSVAYTETPDMGVFMKEWLSLYDSKSGERGIFNRTAAQKKVESLGRREWDGIDFGTNPCSEIILRNREFCNLTEAVIRSTDNFETLKEKVRLATILGTFQSTLTNFKYINKKWKENCEEERLLGVSLTGIMDHPILNGEFHPADHGGTFGYEGNLDVLLQDLKQVAIDTNVWLAKKLGINPATAITCVKPSGTVSQLVDAASGIHDRFAHWFIRTVRADIKDPMTQFMMEMGFPAEPDITKPESTIVFSFPMHSPDASITRDKRNAIKQLEHWLVYQRHWCEHKPSITIYVKEHEWMNVGAWCYEHFDELSGVAFLPHTEHIYRQAPYQDCTESEYYEWIEKMPKNVDWSLLSKFESEDRTVSSQSFACSAEACEIVDIVAN